MLDPKIQIVSKHPFDSHARTVLSAAALRFVADATRALAAHHDRLLVQRAERERRFEGGDLPVFRRETAWLRARAWHCLSIPPALRRRHVELCGPIDRASLLDGLGSGADGFVADFGDATSPSWSNIVGGHANLRAVVRRIVGAPRRTRSPQRAATTGALFLKPRGIHLFEEHLHVEGHPIPAFIFDVALFAFHSARGLASHGEGPLFYLPGLQSYEEARFCNQLFLYLQRALRVPIGTFKATVLVETLPAVFQMNEILWELRAHSAGLALGQRNLVFDFIKTRSTDKQSVLPNAHELDSERSFLAAAATLMVQTCHRRGVHAIGRMAHELPNHDDRAQNAQALASMRREKIHEATLGFDGTRVAHRTLVPVARQVFEGIARGDDQLHVDRGDIEIVRSDLLEVPRGRRTEEGARRNVRVCLIYLDQWLRGRGAVPIDHRLGDAATAEMARAQLWKWLRHEVILDDGVPFHQARFDRVLAAEADRVDASLQARVLLRDLCVAGRMPAFMIVPAYAILTANEDCGGSADERNPQERLCGS